MSKNFRVKAFTLTFIPKPYSLIFYDTKVMKITIQ